MIVMDITAIFEHNTHNCINIVMPESVSYCLVLQIMSQQHLQHVYSCRALGITLLGCILPGAGFLLGTDER